MPLPCLPSVRIWRNQAKWKPSFFKLNLTAQVSGQVWACTPWRHSWRVHAKRDRGILQKWCSGTQTERFTFRKGRTWRIVVGWMGEQQKVWLATSLWVKINQFVWRSLPLLLSSSLPPPVSCDLPKAFHRYFSICSYRCMIAIGNAQTPPIMIRDIVSAPLTSSQLSELLCSL